MVLNTVKKRTGKPDQPPISAFSSTLTEKPKRGRRTIQNNFLLGARNQWVSLLEESWPEIGWPLLQIRATTTTTIDDVRKAFQPVREKPHNAGLAAPFYRETFEVAMPAEVHKNRKRLGDLQAEIHHAQTKLNDMERSKSEMDALLKTEPHGYTESIQKEITKRQEAIDQLGNSINELRIEERRLDKDSFDQEAYVYASELLDYLHSGRYAVTPRSIANALAGLPRMRWRQSHLRCSRMPLDMSRLHYQVLEIIVKIWKRRRRKPTDSVIELFKSQLLKLPKKLGHTRDFLLENWRDLKLAIEDCPSREPEDGEAPYILASIFLRNTRNQKTPLGRMLAEQEKLS